MKFSFGIIFMALLRGVFKVINLILTVVAYVILYFGLWVPCLYLLTIFILWVGFGFNPSIINTETILFYVGLLLSLLASLILTIRRMIIKPLLSISNRVQANKARDKRLMIDRAITLKRKNPDKYYRKYGDIHPYDIVEFGSSKNQSDKKARAPIIYRSNRNQDIVIHEYSDKFDVFTDVSGKLEFLESKHKRNC